MLAKSQGDRRVKSLPVRQIGLLIFAGLCILAPGAFAKKQTKAPAPPTEKAAPAATNPAFKKTIGNPNAPITMEVFGDFQCPACRGFFESTVKQVIDDYVIPGKVYIIHRDFPLDMHPFARQAARLANAAAEFGQFEAIERALYDHQDEWSAKGNIDEVMASYFPPAQFKKFQTFESQHISEINASIERDRAMGVQRNVNQTPTVYITAHGKTEALPGGGVDYKLLKSYFDYLLRQ
jgi:protein-disulfide isomerase